MLGTLKPALEKRSHTYSCVSIQATIFDQPSVAYLFSAIKTLYYLKYEVKLVFFRTAWWYQCLIGYLG